MRSYLNWIFDIYRPGSYTCVMWHIVHVHFPIIIYSKSFLHQDDWWTLLCNLCYHLLWGSYILRTCHHFPLYYNQRNITLFGVPTSHLDVESYRNVHFPSIFPHKIICHVFCCIQFWQYKFYISSMFFLKVTAVGVPCDQIGFCFVIFCMFSQYYRGTRIQQDYK